VDFNHVTLSDENDKPLRSINDVVLDVSNLVTALDRAEDRIETVHVVGSDYLTLTTGDKTIPASEFGDHLESEGHSVHQIDVLEERDFAE